MAIYRMCDHGLEIVLAILFLPCDCGWRHHRVIVWHVWFLKPATCNSSPPKTPETDWQRTALDCSCWTFAMLVGRATIRAEDVLAEKTFRLLAYMVCGNYALNNLNKAF